MTKRKHNEDQHQMEPPTYKVSSRGFVAWKFHDIYGAEASIQESSLGTEAALWLGLDTGTHHMGACMARMHVSVEMAQWLIKRLRVFVKTGYLDRPVDEPETPEVPA